MSRHDVMFVYVGATSQLKVHTHTHTLQRRNSVDVLLNKSFKQERKQAAWQLVYTMKYVEVVLAVSYILESPRTKLNILTVLQRYVHTNTLLHSEDLL